MTEFDDADHLKAYRTILADPPWSHYQDLSFRQVSMPKNRYFTMETRQIAAVPVDRWAANPCVLAMWTTAPHLEEALHVLRSWGFAYVTAIPYVKETKEGKPKRIFGTWFMQSWEILLIGQRGTPGVLKRLTGKGVLGFVVDCFVNVVRCVTCGRLPTPGRVFWARPPKLHSRKPYGVHEWLESFKGPRLELFATEQREGWTTWGFDLGFRLTENGVEVGNAPPPDPQGDMFK